MPKKLCPASKICFWVDGCGWMGVKAFARIAISNFLFPQVFFHLLSCIWSNPICIGGNFGIDSWVTSSGTALSIADYSTQFSVTLHRSSTVSLTRVTSRLKNGVLSCHLHNLLHNLLHKWSIKLIHTYIFMDLMVELMHNYGANYASSAANGNPALS